MKFPEDLNLADYFLFDRQRDGVGRKVAIQFGDRTWTYDQVIERTRALARFFVDSGLRPEQRVYIVLPDVPPFAWSIFATFAAGGVLTMGNQKSVSLSLWPAEQPKASPEPTSFSVVCEALRLEVRLDGSTATVVASDSTVVLQRADTPFGKRYSDGTTTLVVLGEAAYFQGPRRAYRDCLVSLPSGDR